MGTLDFFKKKGAKSQTETPLFCGRNKTMKGTLLGCLAIIMAVCLTSCGDSSLAKSMDGTWKGRITTHYDDQSTEDEDIYLQFNYIESSDKDGGTYIEVREGNAKDIDLDDRKLNVHYTTYIKGEWEVLAGTLSMTPDVSTLKVNVNDDDVKMNYQSFDAAWSDFEDELYSLGGSSREFVSSIQKYLYTELFHEYKSDAETADDEFFDDLEVNEGVMSFTTGDAGKTTMKKVDVKVTDIYGSHSSKKK